VNLRSRASFAPLLGLLALGERSPAQVCVATASPLQAAIDAAQPGDVILLPQAGSNLDCSVCVTKPLTFIGVGPASPVTIEATSALFGGCTYSGATGVFHIAPAVAGTVTFRNLRILGHSGYVSTGNMMRGIYATAPNAVVVLDGCEVRGSDYCCFQPNDSLGHGAAGIEGTLSRLVVRDSFVLGGEAVPCASSTPTFGCGTFPGQCTAGNGGHAIDVTGEVLLVGSYVVGGDGGNAYVPCCNWPSSVTGAAGTGGSAVLASTVWSWGSAGAGGIGGFKYCQGNFLEQAPSGTGFPSGPDSTLFTGPHPSPGGTATLTLQNPFGQFGVIAAGLGGWAPTAVYPGHGPYFLGPNALALAAGTALSGLSLAVPNDPALVGLGVPVQAALGTSFASFEFTNPSLVLIRP